MTGRVVSANLAVVSGFMWCTMHGDIADELSEDPARCAASIYKREARNEGSHCHLVALLHEPPAVPAVVPSAPTHTHDEPTRLHVGCPGCIERVHLDQDIAAVLEGDEPDRSLVNRMHVRLISFAFDVAAWTCDVDDCDDDEVPNVIDWLGGV